MSDIHVFNRAIVIDSAFSRFSQVVTFQRATFSFTDLRDQDGKDKNHRFFSKLLV